MMAEKENEYENLDYYLRLLVHRYAGMEKEYYKKTGLGHLTPAGIRAINRIGHCNKERMTNLAKYLRLTVGTLTTTIDHLVKKGYGHRYRLEDDRRVVEVALSPKGNEAYQQINTSKRLMAEKIFGELSEEERKTLKELLVKIAR
jgi:DNA-binding MarR family transcriptional regulator